MEEILHLYTTSTCKRCIKLIVFLENMGITYKKIVIDENPDTQAEALMLGILAVPALKRGTVMLKPRDFFTPDDHVDEKKMREFLHVQ